MEEGPDSDQVLALCRERCEPAFSDSACQVGFNDEKDELKLSPAGKRADLFQIVSFRHLSLLMF